MTWTTIKPRHRRSIAEQHRNIGNNIIRLLSRLLTSTMKKDMDLPLVDVENNAKRLNWPDTSQ